MDIKNPLHVSSVVMAATLAGFLPSQGHGHGSGGGGGGSSTPPDPAIVYLDTRRGDLMVMDADGANPTTILSGLDDLAQPAISSDGSEIAFADSRAGQDGVFAIHTDGSGLRFVTPIHDPTPALVDPAWSPVPAPDGRMKIAFWDTADGTPSGNWELFVVNTDGTGRQRLTNTPSRSETSPEWSKDGSRIVVNTAVSLIVIQLALVGGQIAAVAETNVTDIPGSPLQGTLLAFPSFANTADVLVVSALDHGSGQYDLWLIDLNALATPVRLTQSSVSERFATFTPDDTHLVYDQGGIRQMNVDGTGIVQLARRGLKPNRRRH
jgi:Tol biopolymer transport system component